MRILVLVLAVLGLSGCTEPEAAGKPAAREPDAVVAALRVLDPCALLPDEDAPVRTGPFACRGGTDPVLTVTVGVWLDPDVAREVAPLAGVRTIRTSGERYCSTTLLTGADLGIAFAADTDKTGIDATLCELTADAAGTAAGLLADPGDLMAAGPHQDACDLLRRAGKAADIEVAEDLDLRFGTTTGTGLGLCQARESVDGGWRTRFSARVSHTRFGAITNERPDVLDGRDVRVYDTGDTCEYGWRARASGAPRPHADTVIQLSGATCAEAAGLASALMPADAEDSPSATPQRPITMPA